MSLENPFDPNSKPINLKFNAERPYFNLPQVKAADLACSPLQAIPVFKLYLQRVDCRGGVGLMKGFILGAAVRSSNAAEALNTAE